MMNRDKMSELPAMQIGFIDSICAPIYSAFARLFPQQLHPLIDGCLSNRELWCQMREKNAKPEVSIINYLACDTDGPKVNEHDSELLPMNLSVSKSATSLQSHLLPGSNWPREEQRCDEPQSCNSNTLEKSPVERTVKSKLTLSSIDRKLAEAGLSTMEDVKKANNVQRRSI